MCICSKAAVAPESVGILKRIQPQQCKLPSVSGRKSSVCVLSVQLGLKKKPVAFYNPKCYNHSLFFSFGTHVAAVPQALQKNLLFSPHKTPGQVELSDRLRKHGRISINHYQKVQKQLARIQVYEPNGKGSRILEPMTKADTHQ